MDIGARVSDDFDERKAFFNRRTDKTIVSKRFLGQSGEKLRIATHIVDGQPGLIFATIGDEVVLRETAGGRYEIKATFLEDSRAIRTLTIQKYHSGSRASPRVHFSFVGDEIETLRNFIGGIYTMPLDGPGKVHVADDALRDIVLDLRQARQVFEKNTELFLEIAQQEDLARDIVAVGYRRKQLEHFDALLRNAEFFAAEQSRLNCKAEAVWQRFFEANTWIFGYGLSYQFLSNLDDRKLEQIVRGSDITGTGKRTDALMKTRGRISSLCFIEIKRHDTPLVSNSPYRPGVWPPSPDLAGGVSQMQAAVHAAVEKLGRKVAPEDADGDPTGEVLFNIEPRSCIVVGSLEQFKTANGINETKLRSFELYRRHTWRPEIITFDELLERARFIVEQGPEPEPEPEQDDEEMPF